MVTRDMPTISDSAHAHSTYSLGNLATPIGTFVGTSAANAFDDAPWLNLQAATPHLATGLMMPARQTVAANAIQPQPKKEKEKLMAQARRLVQVFIADPDENVPLENSLIYSGEQKLTDLTDQELFFEIDIKVLLSAHNEKRTTIVNKKVKERTEYLEPVKVRDLKMVVVNVATF